MQNSFNSIVVASFYLLKKYIMQYLLKFCQVVGLGRLGNTIVLVRRSVDLISTFLSTLRVRVCMALYNYLCTENVKQLWIRESKNYQ